MSNYIFASAGFPHIQELRRSKFDCTETTVKHFDITRWADFARGVGSREAQAEMQEHLSSGCEACAHTRDLLHRFGETLLSAEATPPVPAAVLQRAEGIFRLRQPEKIGFVQVLAQLVYDSFREPLPVGIRTGRSGSRQVLYEAGDICIDLRLEFEKGGALVSLVGQVSNRQRPHHSLAGVPLVLMSGTELLARTLTNQYGEFQLEYEPRNCLSLHLSSEQNWIQVPLAGAYETQA
jgi:hypothetical protein